MANDIERADEHYLDAIEASEEKDVEGALSSARLAVKSNPEHSEAWWLISKLELPVKAAPNLKQVARSLAACKKVIALDPENEQAWRQGARLHEEIGLYEDALEWWNQRRVINPEDTEAVIEQTALMVDLGFYDEAMGLLQVIFDNDLDLLPHQMSRLSRLHQMVQKAATKGRLTPFKPWEKKHPGWAEIKARSNKGPVSETYLFLLLVVPFLVIEIWLSRGLNQAGWSGFCFSSSLILLTVILGIRFTKSLFHKVNRPSFNVIRAMDVETTSGCKVIPEDLRLSRLYMSILGKRPKAYQERLLAIIEKGDDLPKNWKPKIPDFDLALPSEEE
jgi:tetratricopeptide (TPR) repeat protein